MAHMYLGALAMVICSRPVPQGSRTATCNFMLLVEA